MMQRYIPLIFSSLAALLIHTAAEAADSDSVAPVLKRRTISLTSGGREVAGILLPIGPPTNVKLVAQKTEFAADGTVHATGRVQLSLFLGKLAPITLHGDEMYLRSEELDEEEAKAVSDLQLIGESDQSLRQKTSAMTADDITRQAAIDVKNMKRLAAIIDHYGWPGNHFAGAEAAENAFFVLQHADKANQQKYLPLFRAAVAKGDANTADLALLEDRMLVRDGKPQLYGTQFQSAKSLILYPIQDEAHLELRRREMGLPPMEDYLKRMRELYQAK